MISNQILQSTIDGLKMISRIDFAVIDLEGNVLASTNAEAEEFRSAVVSFCGLTGGQPGGAGIPVF